MKTDRGGWVGLAVVAAVLAWGGAGTAWAASYAWDGNGSSDNSENWSNTASWNPDSTAGRPNNTDDVTLPNVTNGLRTITFNGTGTGAKTLTITQTTVGATNKLVLSQNMVSGQFAWAINGLTRNLNPAGTIVIDKGSYNFQPWFSGSGNTAPATLGANVVVNSTGGLMQDMWDGPNTPLKFQGTVNLSSGVTTFGDGNTMTLDTGAVMTLASGGGASVGNGGTLTVKGTVNGNSTGSLRARTLILDAGSAVPTSVANIYANNFSIRSTTPGSVALSGSTLRRVNNVTTADFEAAASGAGTNFKIGTLALVNVSGTYNGSRYRLVNSYANSADQASEYFLVGTFNGTGAYQEEFDLNGQKLVIDGGVANYVNTGNAGVRLSNRSSGHGVMEFRTAGGTLNLNNTAVGVSSGGILEIVGPASISNFNLEDAGTSVGNNGGTIKFNGNISAAASDISITTANSILTIDLVSAGRTFSSGRNFSVANGSTVTFNGNFSGSGADNTRGLVASGNANPALAGTIVLTGNYTSSGNGVRTVIGQNATLKVGGNFAPGATWDGVWGTFWSVNTSATPGIFVLNGGGASTQDFEIMSNGYGVSGDTLVTQVGSGVSRVPFGTISIGKGATPASVRLVNNTNLSGTDNQQVARNLVVTTNSVFDLRSFKMVVALGTNSVAAGLVTNSVAGGTLILANSATLKFGTGGVIDVDTLTISAGCTVDFNKAMGSYFRVNGNQKAAFDALIVGAQIVDNGGDLVKTGYSAGDNHTTVYLAERPPSGTLISVR